MPVFGASAGVTTMTWEPSSVAFAAGADPLEQQEPEPSIPADSIQEIDDGSRFNKELFDELNCVLDICRQDAEAGSQRLMEFVVKRPGMVNIQPRVNDIRRWPAFHQVCRSWSLKVMNWNLTDFEEFRHSADGLERCIKFLVESKANIWNLNRDGKNAWGVACKPETGLELPLNSENRDVKAAVERVRDLLDTQRNHAGVFVYDTPKALAKATMSALEQGMPTSLQRENLVEQFLMHDRSLTSLPLVREHLLDCYVDLQQKFLRGVKDSNWLASSCLSLSLFRFLARTVCCCSCGRDPLPVFEKEKYREFIASMLGDEKDGNAVLFFMYDMVPPKARQSVLSCALSKLLGFCGDGSDTRALPLLGALRCRSRSKCCCCQGCGCGYGRRCFATAWRHTFGSWQWRLAKGLELFVFLATALRNYASMVIIAKVAIEYALWNMSPGKPLVASLVLCVSMNMVFGGAFDAFHSCIVKPTIPALNAFLNRSLWQNGLIDLEDCPDRQDVPSRFMMAGGCDGFCPTCGEKVGAEELITRRTDKCGPCKRKSKDSKLWSSIQLTATERGRRPPTLRGYGRIASMLGEDAALERRATSGASTWPTQWYMQAAGLAELEAPLLRGT